ncbi:hypothetical protein [Pseudomonas sp. BMS12]|uniref:hypothetical protein n=1 Tax=Pseudomonas sp. BMS12 TaxID=1796033 RepID=UPI00083AA96B|nr:hypothetical protein [Pseudomonas sp. BMS12]
MEQASKTPLSVDLATLPLQLMVPGFAEEYEQHRQSNESSSAASFFKLLGYGVLIVGVLTLFFGPDTVMVNRLSGPDFFQFVQLYPGPISTVGFLIVSGASLMDAQKLQLMPEAYLLAHYPLEPQGELGEGLQLQVAYLGDSRFQLSAVAQGEETLTAQP